MSKKGIYENVSALSNSIDSTNTGHRLNNYYSIDSTYDGSIPSSNANDQYNPLKEQDLPRFPEDLNDNLFVKTKDEELGRWNEAWNKHEEQQNTKPKNKIDMSSIHGKFSPTTDLTNVVVKEFLPTSARDPTFPILRELFVRSFDEFYKEIETQLRLKSQKSLIQWLDETFDEEQEAILSKEYRCFILYGNKDQDQKDIIFGFLTLKEEEEGSVYIAQVAVRAGDKRRGYGGQLLQHLRDIYPPNTHYYGLCRRANRPALQFYLKLGADFMKNDEIATKYGYDPELYAGFKFVDAVPVIGSKSGLLSRIRSPVNNSDKQTSTKITNGTSNNEISPSTKIGQQPAIKKTTHCSCILS
ncbi:hypothetical protein I4U23_010401 [Adineta vaga]|nr:hypothetical protein I4U23_010401 [Adineta vaga]